MIRSLVRIYNTRCMYADRISRLQLGEFSTVRLVPFDTVILTPHRLSTECDAESTTSADLITDKHLSKQPFVRVLTRYRCPQSGHAAINLRANSQNTLSTASRELLLQSRTFSYELLLQLSMAS